MVDLSKELYVPGAGAPPKPPKGAGAGDAAPNNDPEAGFPKVFVAPNAPGAAGAAPPKGVDPKVEPGAGAGAPKSPGAGAGAPNPPPKPPAPPAALPVPLLPCA